MRLRGAMSTLALPLLAGIAIGCGDQSTGGDDGGDSDKFILAVVNGQTGYLAPFDTAILAGVRDKVKELNEDGGLGGKFPIKIVVKDTGSDIGKQATLTQEVIDNGADAVILACDSDPSISGGQVAQRAEVPSFGCPASPKAVGEFLFHMAIPERSAPTVAAEYALKRGWDNAFTLGSPDTAFTENLVSYFAQVLEKEGGRVVGEGTFGLDQQDFANLVNRIRDLNPDVIYTSMYEPSILSFMKQLRGAGVSTPVIGDQALETPAIQALPAEAREELYFVSLADTNPGTPVGDYIAEIAEEYGKDAGNAYVIDGADTVTALHIAAQDAGIDHRKLADAVSSLKEFEGLTAPISYEWPGSDRSQLREVVIKSPLGGDKTKVWETTVPDPTKYPPIIGQ